MARPVDHLFQGSLKDIKTVSAAFIMGAITESCRFGRAGFALLPPLEQRRAGAGSGGRTELLLHH